MAKYTIETDGNTADDIGGYLGIRIEICNKRTWVKTDMELTPYTEPDLDAIRKEAYQRGYEQGYMDGHNEPGKGKIQVGDEVKCIRAGWTAVVTKIKEGCMTLMGNDGAVAYSYDEKDFIKTGRHFPEIAEVLEKMRGE